VAAACCRADRVSQVGGACCHFWGGVGGEEPEEGAAGLGGGRGRLFTIALLVLQPRSPNQNDTIQQTATKNDPNPPKTGSSWTPSGATAPPPAPPPPSTTSASCWWRGPASSCCPPACTTTPRRPPGATSGWGWGGTGRGQRCGGSTSA